MLKGSDRAADRFAVKVETPGTAPNRVFEAFTAKAAEKAAKAITLPVVPTLEQIKAEMPKIEGLQLQIDLADQFKSFAKSQEFQEAMTTALKSAWAKRVLGKVKEAEGGALEEAMEGAAWAAQNPEQAQYLAAAHTMIDGPLSQVMNWDEKKKKLLHQQAVDLAQQGADLRDFMEKMGGGFLKIEGGGGRANAGKGPQPL